MSIVFVLAAIAIIFIVTINMGKGTKSENGDFVLRALAGNGDVALILEKVKRPLVGSVFIPNGVTTIGYEVFYNMNQIIDVHIHEKVKIIGQRSFKGCIGISSLYLGEGTEKVGDEAFDGCSGIKELLIGPRLTEIQSNAFRGCCNIQNIKIEGYNIPNIFSNTFEDITKSNCILYVKSGHLEAISKAPGWSGFKNIKEIQG